MQIWSVHEIKVGGRSVGDAFHGDDVVVDALQRLLDVNWRIWREGTNLKLSDGAVAQAICCNERSQLFGRSIIAQ